MASSNDSASKPSKLIFAPGAHDQNPTSSDTTTPSTADPSHTAKKPNQAAQFTLSSLHRSHLSSDPIAQFHSWFTHPRLRGTVPETVCLSTASLPSGRVSNRMVYLKELDERGFVIYSNFGTSNKAKDLETNKHAALCFWWKDLERQVRVEGVSERLSDEESQKYFDTRERGSRVGAWASRQSKVLMPGVGGGGDRDRTDEGKQEEEEDDGRAELDGQVKEIENKFEGKDEIPVPSFWGGLRVIPDMIEFWQGRQSRLHDRFRYTKQDDGSWKVDRLSP